MSMIFFSFADDCRISKKRKSEEHADQMHPAEQNRKLAKTQVSDKVNCVKTRFVYIYSFVLFVAQCTLVKCNAFW